jgi:hypothetical protein
MTNSLALTVIAIASAVLAVLGILAMVVMIIMVLQIQAFLTAIARQVDELKSFIGDVKHTSLTVSRTVRDVSTAVQKVSGAAGWLVPWWWARRRASAPRDNPWWWGGLMWAWQLWRRRQRKLKAQGRHGATSSSAQ